ncbi:MAG: alpha-amylase family glycosyl hydrolase [Candidatus Marinimicrobia bacterium]|nr:alpha-amylase family glycosyl hydrolase [Candidatus Neomarinimicrobiota bacterium]MDD5708983.1 alpha-amylase family glycosyl hydrolase [Candidatus Neomarinimicrobiota bacterium]
MKKFYLLIIALILSADLYALDIKKIEPPNWWVGMEHDTVKVLLYGDDFSGWEASLHSRNVRIVDACAFPNMQFYALTLKIRRAGDCRIVFSHEQKGQKTEIIFPVLERKARKIGHIGPEDVVYLLMPDRFADGDPDNNIVPGHKDPLRPEHRWGRRGGDLQGVMDHLGYLQELGISALWMTPVYENDYINCYHGYTPTNTYAVEPHLGTLETYIALVDSCHTRGIKVIQDHIVNHIAPTHPIAVNPPSPEWLNGTLEDHENCNYRILDVTDVHAPESVRRKPVEGWFAGYLADMNLRHPDVVTYWAQHAIWWIETAGLDGLRQDTYAYSDLDGLHRWAEEVRREYPGIFIVAEAMEFDRTRLAYFFQPGQRHYLSSLADFGLSSEIYQLIAEGKSIADFYRSLANDFIYDDPNMMLVFMDNHDMGRFFTAVNGNIRDYLNAFALVFTLRGIPQIYYGNEIGMEGGHDPDNRREFPGGFTGTERSAFEKNGRTAEENRIFEQFRTFTALRKEHPQLFRETMQHDLQGEAYLLRRGLQGSETLLLTVYNASENKGDIFYGRLLTENFVHIEILKPVSTGTMQIDTAEKKISLPGRESTVLLFKK